MSDISKNALLEKLGLSEEQGKQLLDAASSNPMEALGLLQSFNPDPAALQNLMAEFMANPGAFIQLAEELGLPQDKINAMKAGMGQ